MPPLFSVPWCPWEPSFFPTSPSPSTFFQGRKDNVFLALIISLTTTFIPCTTRICYFFPYTAEEPVSGRLILLFSQYLPSESDRVHVKIENTHFCKQYSRWIHLNWAEHITDRFYIAHCPVRCHIKIAWLLVNIVFQINSQPEKKQHVVLRPQNWCVWVLSTVLLLTHCGISGKSLTLTITILKPEKQED